jgi:uncharacterized integral membrane protein (TIGR00698 family)
MPSNLSIEPEHGAVRRLAPGLAVAAAGVTLALLLHRVVGSVGVLTWAVLLGAVAANTGLLPQASRAGLEFAARRLLRGGIVLLGLLLPVAAIATLGPPVIAMIVATLLITLLATLWCGRRLGLGRPRSLLVATGFAICGASAVAAMQGNAEADEDDVATAIAMVTLCGTVAMVAVPLLQVPLGLGDRQLGVWAGASVHEVGQVIAAAGPAGAAAVAVAVVVKLTRVLLLAPVVLGFGLLRARPAGGTSGRRPPLVPVFVLGFLACAGVRSLDVLPTAVLDVLAGVQVAVLSAALFGLGAGVRLAALFRSGGRALTLGAVSTLVVTGVSLSWVLWLVSG